MILKKYSVPAPQVGEMPGCNGTPPMVYGVSYNPRRPQDGSRGSEFCSFGVKHLKTWIVNESRQWQVPRIFQICPNSFFK